MKLILIVLSTLLLLGCGGSDEPYECRPDFVGPPHPDQAGLPICDEAPEHVIPST